MCVRDVGLCKFFENFGLYCFGYVDIGVLDFDLQRDFFWIGIGILILCLNEYVVFVGEFDSIIDQIQQYLVDMVDIVVQKLDVVWCDYGCNFDVFVEGFRCQQFDYMLKCFGQIEVYVFQFDFVGFEFGVV